MPRHRWPDEEPAPTTLVRTEGRSPSSVVRKRSFRRPVLIRRLGKLTGRTLGCFQLLEQGLAPLITNTQRGQRIKTPAEMYVSIADERWVDWITEKQGIPKETLLAELKARLPLTAWRETTARIAPGIVRVAGRASSTSNGKVMSGGHTRLELLLTSPEVLRNCQTAESWVLSQRSGLTIPARLGMAAMTLNWQTTSSTYFPAPVLRDGTAKVSEIMPPGLEIPLGPVVPYYDVFDATDHLLVGQQ